MRGTVCFNSFQESHLTIEGYFPQTWEKPPGLERWAGETWSGKHTPPFLTNKTVRGENQRKTRWKENFDKSSPKNLKLFFCFRNDLAFFRFFPGYFRTFPGIRTEFGNNPKKAQILLLLYTFVINSEIPSGVEKLRDKWTELFCLMNWMALSEGIIRRFHFGLSAPVSVTYEKF